MESYSRGRRGVPAKDVGVERRARVQIPHSPPSTTIYCGIFYFITYILCYVGASFLKVSRI